MKLSSLLLWAPRLVAGARRYTMPRGFDARKVLRPEAFGSHERVGGRRPVQELLEELRSLASGVREGLGAGHSVAVCSASHGEGRSLVAANLAVVLAHDLQREVVLLDLDLRNPSQHELFELPVGPGFAEAGDGSKVDALLQATPYPWLRVLTAGSACHDPVPLLHDGRLARILERLAARDALVVIDTPPVCAHVDARLVGESVDGVVMVVRLGRTRRAQLATAYRSLSNARILGASCNFGEDWIPGWLERFL